MINRDLVVVGGGPAGMTAGLYAGRSRMKALLIEKTMCGGQVLITATAKPGARFRRASMVAHSRVVLPEPGLDTKL